jgi:hypothetical protein
MEPTHTTNAILEPQISVAAAAADLEAAFERFRAAHPDVAQAMELMQISFPDYIAALEALQYEPSLTSDNNAASR